MLDKASARFKAFVLGFLGLMLHSFSRYREAERVLSRAIDLSPESTYSYGLRAYNRLYLEDFKGAREDCTTRISLTPGDASVYSLRARVHYITGAFDMVRDDVEKALFLQPDRRFHHVDCLRLLEAYKYLGEYEKLIEFATSCLGPKVDRELRAEILERRSHAYVMLGRRDLAIADLSSAIEIAGVSSLVDLFFQRSQLHEKDRQSELAERDRLNASHLQSHRVQMTEWIPAGPFQRLFAKMADGVLVGVISSLVVLLLGLSTGALSFSADAAGQGVLLPLWSPALLTVIIIGTLDTLLPCLAPALLVVAAPELILRLSTQAASPDSILRFLIDDPLSQTIAVLSVVILANWLYHACFESSRWQATPGKGALKIRITDRDGTRISFSRASSRYLLRMIPAFIIVFATAAFVCMTLGSGYPERFFGGVVFLLFFVLGVGASVNPGLHNSLTMCLVTDNFMYTPKLDLSKVRGLPDRD